MQKYVRFGEVFSACFSCSYALSAHEVLLTVNNVADLLHAGASYLRIHQKGFGVVGVSTKYGKRAFARYPIFWGMKDVGGLPNPDPTDTASWYGEQIKTEEITVDEELEDSKPKLKRQAQNWAGLVLFKLVPPVLNPKQSSHHSEHRWDDESLTPTTLQTKAGSKSRAFRLRWKVSARS